VALYPLVFWGMNQIILLQRGSMESMPSRIAFLTTPADELVWEILEHHDSIEIKEIAYQPGDFDSERLRSLELDLAVKTNGCGQLLDIQLYFDGSSDRSLEAKERISGLVQDITINRLIELSETQNINMPDLRFIGIDLSSVGDRSKFLLGIILPMVIVIITVMGGLYPSIEVIVSGRERKTLETSLLAPVSGIYIVLGKFLAVVTMSVLASTLNIVSILLTIKHTLFVESEFGELSFQLPLSTLPFIFLGILLVAAMFSALMILLASFAGNFKEGQSFVMPVYAIGIQPAVVSAIPGVPFNNTTALIPITNISLMFREIIRGDWNLVPMLITLGSLTVFCLILLLIAKRFITQESFIFEAPKYRFGLKLMKWFKRNKNREKNFD